MRRKSRPRINFTNHLNSFIRNTVLTTVMTVVALYFILNSRLSYEYDGARIVTAIKKEASPWLEKTVEGGVKLVKLLGD